ncbi:MAG: hypothetical protein AB1486_31380 [Planctomycetota bacterium]
MGGRSSIPWLVRGLLVIALPLQVAVALRFEVRTLREAAGEWRSFSLERVEASPSDLDAELYRCLLRLTREIPEGASVVLLTGVLRPLSYEYYLAPYRASILHRFDSDLVGRLIELQPDQARVIRAYFDFLDERGLRLTPERLDEALRQADYVITYRIDAALIGGRPFVTADRYSEIAVLWRREGGS